MALPKFCTCSLLTTWFVISANCKWFRNLAVARIVVGYLEGLKIRHPLPTVDLEAIRKEYENTANEAVSKHG